MVNGEIFDSEGICCSHGGGKSKNNGNVGILIRFQTVTNHIFDRLSYGTIFVPISFSYIQKPLTLCYFWAEPAKGKVPHH